MQIGNTKERWGAVTQAFHWLVVLAVITQLLVGLAFASRPPDAESRAELFPVHTTLGLTILLLMIARLVWRLSNPVPTLEGKLKPWQQKLAHGTHWLLYLLLIGLPIGGYLLVSASGHDIPFFGITLPAAIGANDGLKVVIATMHVTGALLLVLLITLHVGGAVRHALILRDGVLRRMTPFRRSGTTRQPVGGSRSIRAQSD